MKLNIVNKLFIMLLTFSMVIMSSCDSFIDEPLENTALLEDVDYTQTENMFQLLTGSYANLYGMQWETYPLLAIRGDDVNAAGDQVPLQETDVFKYDRSFWMYNSVWLNLYSDIVSWHASIEEINKFKQFAPNPTEADQYIAEIRVMQALELFQLARLWGNILIPSSSQTFELYTTPVSSFEEVMQFISEEMDEVIPLLPNMHPAERNDIPGGITRYTALAIKALANLELKNWQAVADATGAIIGSNEFSLSDDFYQLFKKPGKLNRENILEFQYSDFGQGAGESRRFWFVTFGPQGWTPARTGVGGGWGFYEPTVKYIKFMLDRNEQIRLETSVLFTNDGIAQIQSDPAYATLPAWISNTTRDGDVINNYARADFASGKHYLPSTQITPGRNAYGEGKNLIVIRYAEILLMHAEALVSGANSSELNADQAVNLVRERAGLSPLSGVSLDDVLDEKFAELGLEWGIRFYDLVRHNKTSELDYEGRDYDESEDRFLVYPLPQLDLLPQLDSNNS
ncbi:MAG: RagB/SusD family nutrient uptake outer membrane protein [Cyclobacteriaceae bacterium]